MGDCYSEEGLGLGGLGGCLGNCNFWTLVVVGRWL